MFTRSILIPSLVVCAIAAPVLLSNFNQGPPPAESQNGSALQVGYDNSANAWLPTTQANGQFALRVQQTKPANYQNAPNGNPIFLQTNASGNPAPLPATANHRGMVQPNFPQQSPTGFGTPFQSGLNPVSSATPMGSSAPPDTQFVGMTPDYGATQTFIYPGNAEGPDYSATPLEFMPVTNFEEIFRFDVSPDWITSRWNRVSTSPGDQGLHGLRVALVTGTNSWDLHGSLTYFFDTNQQLQRITFRGWAGNAVNLTNLLKQRYDFRTQPTHWAGFCLAKKGRTSTGGILIQHPTVIYRDNPVQQVAVVMEINNPRGQFVLSDEFQSLIVGMQNSQ